MPVAELGVVRPLERHPHNHITMSINALTNAAVARRTDFTPLGTVPRGLGEIAIASAIPPTCRKTFPNFYEHVFDLNSPEHDDSATPAAAPHVPPTPPPSASGVDTALHVIFGYIPTEILTLYVAVLAALHQPGRVSQPEWITFSTFSVATPIVVWLLYAAKVKAANKPIPIPPSQWPIWEMFAATIAYFAWAFALPNSPFSAYHWYSSAIAGIIVLLASTGLGLLAPLFQRPINDSKAA